MPGTFSSRDEGTGGTLFGALRALGVILVIFTVLAAYGVRAAEARGAEAARDFGEELLAWPGAHFDGAARALSLNGLVLHLATTSTPLPVAEALARFATVCSAHGGVDVQSVLSASPGKRNGAPLGLGIYSTASASTGILGCIDSGRPLGARELAARLGLMLRSGDLSQLGNLRYVLARRSAQSTSLLVIWTEGPAALFRSFPATGDAPGRDPIGIARPRNSRRILSAAERETPYAITVYSTTAQGVRDASNAYQQALESGGWTLKAVGTDGAVLAIRGARSIVVRTLRVSSGAILIAIVELSSASN